MSRYHCAFCGRPTEPFCLLGGMAVGPTCARKAGLTPRKAAKNPRVKFLARQEPRRPPENRDLFEELPPC